MTEDNSKCDLPENQRQVTTEEVFNLARSHGYLFYEISSLNSNDVYLSFISIIEKAALSKKLKKVKSKSEEKNAVKIESNLIALSASGLKNVIFN